MGLDSFALSDVQSMLLSISNDHLVYTAIPIMFCMAEIHLIFEHFFSIAWFSVKLLISLLIYVQIRDNISKFLGPDPYSVESSIFGVPPGTLQLSASIGFHLVKARILSTIFETGWCPTCFVKEESVPVEKEGFVSSLWVDWMSNIIEI